MNIRREFHVAVNEMPKIKPPNYGYYQKYMVDFYEDRGHLYWSHGRRVDTCDAFFIQAVDGRIQLVISSALDLTCTIADPNVKSDVIKCRVAVDALENYIGHDGVLFFMADRHPDFDTRAKFIITIAVDFARKRNLSEEDRERVNDIAREFSVT